MQGGGTKLRQKFQVRWIELQQIEVWLCRLYFTYTFHFLPSQDVKKPRFSQKLRRKSFRIVSFLRMKKCFFEKLCCSMQWHSSAFSECYLKWISLQQYSDANLVGGLERQKYITLSLVKRYPTLFGRQIRQTPHDTSRVSELQCYDVTYFLLFFTLLFFSSLFLGFSQFLRLFFYLSKVLAASIMYAQFIQLNE